MSMVRFRPKPPGEKYSELLVRFFVYGGFMEIKRKSNLLGSTIYLIIGLLLMFFGLFLAIFNKVFYFNAINILLSVMLLNGMLNIIKCLKIKNTKRNKKSMILALFNIVLSFVLLSFPEIPQSIIPFLFSIYLIIYSLTKLFINLFFVSDKKSIIKRELLLFIFMLLCGLSLLIEPLKHIGFLIFLVSFYLIFRGLILLLLSFLDMLPHKSRNKLLNKIRIRLPIWLEVILPYTVLLDINKSLQTENSIINSDEKFNDSDIDVEIMVHVSKRGGNKVGHVDIIYNNEVYTYGNYDEKYKKFYQLIGEGVLCIVDKNKYIPFCCKHSKKILFCFGLKLTDEQKNQFENKLLNLKENLIEWVPISIKEKKYSECKDYCSVLCKKTKAKTYKFKDGKFKTYCVLGLSCCDIVNELFVKSGIKFLKMNGVICPGTYFYRLNSTFLNGRGQVVSRKIFTESNCREIFK